MVYRAGILLGHKLLLLLSFLITIIIILIEKPPPAWKSFRQIFGLLDVLSLFGGKKRDHVISIEIVLFVRAPCQVIRLGIPCIQKERRAESGCVSVCLEICIVLKQMDI